MGKPIMVYADDNLLQNTETLLVAGKKLNKLRMFTHQKHKGQNHKERYKKALLKYDHFQIFENKKHSQIKRTSKKELKAAEIRGIPATLRPFKRLYSRLLSKNMKTKIYRTIIYLLKESLSNSQIGTNKF
jgi:hypothetical protein